MLLIFICLDNAVGRVDHLIQESDRAFLERKLDVVARHGEGASVYETPAEDLQLMNV